MDEGIREATHAILNGMQTVLLAQLKMEKAHVEALEALRIQSRSTESLLKQVANLLAKLEAK